MDLYLWTEEGFHWTFCCLDLVIIVADDSQFLLDDLGRTRYFHHPERELFIWALLFNRMDLAKIFWRVGNDHIGASLTASMLLKSLVDMSNREEEYQLAKQLNDSAIEFETMARDVLDECYKKSKKMAHDLLVRDQSLWGRATLFTLSNASEQMEFMQHDCCQTKLNSLWKGKMAIYTQMWKIVLGLFCPFIIIFFINFTYDDENDETSDTTLDNRVVPDDVDRKLSASSSLAGSQQVLDRRPTRPTGSRMWFASKCCSCGSCMMRTLRPLYYFYTAPVVKFFYHTLSYIIYLCLFSYFLLIDLQPYAGSIVEYIVWGWTATLLVEELREIFTIEGPTAYQKMLYYISDPWNWFDIIAYLFFITSIILRYSLDEDMFVWARMIYCVTISLCFMRFLQAFYVSMDMGPTVVMVKRMLKDLLHFLCLFAVFLLCYGVIAQALMYPNSEPTWRVLYMVVYQPFFALFQQYNLLELQGGLPGCTNNATLYNDDPITNVRCSQSSWLAMIYFTLYILITGIMLLNILIAIFSCTIQSVHDKAEATWRFYRFGLINEYFERPTLAPPLIILSHLWELGYYLLVGCKNEKKIQHDFRKELEPEEQKRLTAFEKAGTENYFASKRSDEEGQTDFKVTTTEEKIEKLLIDVESLKEAMSKQDGGVEEGMIQEPPGDYTDSRYSAEKQLKNKHLKKKEFDRLNSRLSMMDNQMQQLLMMMKQVLQIKPGEEIQYMPKRETIEKHSSHMKDRPPSGDRHSAQKRESTEKLNLSQKRTAEENRLSESRGSEESGGMGRPIDSAVKIYDYDYRVVKVESNDE